MYILEKIYEIARDTPDKIAIVNDGVEYGYRHFYQAVMAARRRLEPEGRSDGRVGTFLVRSIVDAWATSMALSSLGYATLALPRGADAAHLGRLDVALMVVRTAEGRRAEALTNVPAGAKVVEIDSDFATDGLAEGELPSPPMEPMVGGHIMLTSGTTGAYKCMQIPAEREALLKLVPPSDSVLNLLQFNLWTAVGCSSPLGAWCGGAAVIFQREPDLYKSFNYKRITHAFATPAFLASILRAPEGSFPRHEGLRLTVFGGALSARQAAEARRRIATTVLASFGSSEVGNWALTEIKTDEDLKWHQVTAGWTVEVVDEADGVLPVGQLGRLRVKVPPGIPQEYHRDPGATANFFRDGWFYPGDLAVQDAAGRLAFHGRVTNVINVMGDKLPAEPIEQALQDRLGVDTVCVMSEQGADQGEALHVVIETPTELPPARLAEAMRGVVRGFADARFHFVPAMPRTQTGKVARLPLRQQILARQVGT